MALKFQLKRFAAWLIREAELTPPVKVIEI